MYVHCLGYILYIYVFSLVKNPLTKVASTRKLINVICTALYNKVTVQFISVEEFDGESDTDRMSIRSFQAITQVGA